MGEITAAVACFNNGFEVMDSILLKQYASQLHLLTGHTVLNKTNVAVPLSAGVWQSLLRLLPRMQWPSFAELVLMRKKSFRGNQADYQELGNSPGQPLQFSTRHILKNTPYSGVILILF